MKSIVLTSVQLNHYKSYETEQSFEVDQKITVLVGKNESGKTAALEAIAKTHYFAKDSKFIFNPTHDYPRREKKKYDKTEEVDKVVTCTYSLSTELLKRISQDVGPKTFNISTFTVTTDYENEASIGGIKADFKAFLNHFSNKHSITTRADIEKLSTLTKPALIEEYKVTEAQAHNQRQTDENQKAKTEGRTPKVLPTSRLVESLSALAPYLKQASDGWEGVEHYIYSTYLAPNLPKFLYYDEYYALPSRIDIELLKSGNLDGDDQKTAKAFFELADINIDDLTSGIMHLTPLN